MSEWPICTELPEDVWKTSTWYPHELVDKRIRQFIKEGKKLPSEDTVRNAINDMAKMIKDNGGISHQKPLDFSHVLERLEEE